LAALAYSTHVVVVSAPRDESAELQLSADQILCYLSVVFFGLSPLLFRKEMLRAYLLLFILIWKRIS